MAGGGARIVDKITPGGSDGFLLDTLPGNSLRFICGETVLQQANALPADRWTHVAAVADPVAGGCRLYVNGKLAAGDSGVAVRDEAAYVSQMYHLQRFITACAGRGAYPIKFNGSLFTVPPGPTEADPDYRRWGPGYWWQNTRLPYISLCASGDFDLQRPLFRMYADELLPLCKYRTRLYLGHDGAFYPECIYFWGAIFSETYGWTPFEQRTDKLQESGWHKWEWVGGLELCWMMLDYYEHTLDRDVPAPDRAALSPRDPDLLRPALPHRRAGQARDAPLAGAGDLVGLHQPHARTGRLHRRHRTAPRPAGRARAGRRARALWQRLRDKLPPLAAPRGRRARRPSRRPRSSTRNATSRTRSSTPCSPSAWSPSTGPTPSGALEALRHRWDRGNCGWRQDDIFMAYLGLAEDARKYVVGRARSHDRNERFPAFWGPNYDWTPDQDHGGVLMKTFQAMLLQTDGPQIFLLPAWPKDWDVEFKLHAPQQTVVEGVYRDGKLELLRVTPASRRPDVTVR